jgi:thiol:disulfide interchange protein DsbA
MRGAWLTSTIAALLGGVMLLGGLPQASAGQAELKGKFEVIKEPSAHQPGKVKLTEFADFYCPHCHRFEQEAVPILEKEFGNKLEVMMVGFPVIPNKLPIPFEMYEQAKTMGKGQEMKRVLFRTIHKDKADLMYKTIREAVVAEVGLDVAAFEAGLASGKPLKTLEQGKVRVNVQQTPTVLLDGNIKVEAIDPDNLRTIIRSILDADKKK